MSGELLDKRQSDLQTAIARWLLGLVLAVGGGMVWLIFASWLSMWLSQRLNQPALERKWQFLEFRESGEPIIDVQRVSLDSSFRTEEYRTLDGQAVDVEPGEISKMRSRSWMVGTFPRPYLNTSSGALHFQEAPVPLPWKLRQSIFSLYDLHGSNPEFWFLRWPDRADGSAYWSVYDSTTKTLQGYLGRSGWSQTVPAESDQFPAWDQNQRDIALIVNDRIEWTFPPNGNSLMVLDDSPQPDVGLLYVTPRRDTIYVINQRRRTVEVVRTMTDEPLLGIAVRPEGVRPLSIPLVGGVAATSILLTWPDRVEFVTPRMKTLRMVPLPEELRGRSFQLVEVKSGGFVGVFDASPFHRDITVHEQQLVWFNDNGEVTQRRTFSRPLRYYDYNYWFDWRPDQFVPPLSMMPISLSHLWQQRRGRDLFDENGEPLRQEDEPMTWSRQWKELRALVRTSPWSSGFCLLSGLPFAIACCVRQNRLGATRFERIAWPALVYLFGPVGWLAFVSHRAWPVGPRSAPMSS